MGKVRSLLPAGDITLGRAIDAYLATLAGAEQQNTRRAYSGVLRRMAAEFGTGSVPDEISAEQFAAWFGQQWGERAPSTWNVSLDAVRSAAIYWQRQGWLAADPSRMLVRRKPRADHSRALSRADVEQLLTREDIGLRERTLWRMLYETAARSAEVLALNAEDGTGTPMLMARSGHTSVRSLARYARVSAEALERHQAERDPARRR